MDEVLGHVASFVGTQPLNAPRHSEGASRQQHYRLRLAIKSALEVGQLPVPRVRADPAGNAHRMFSRQKYSQHQHAGGSQCGHRSPGCQPVRGNPRQDDNGDLDAEHHLPCRPLFVPRRKNVPDPGYQQHRVSRHWMRPKARATRLVASAKGPHSRGQAGDDDLAADPHGRGQDVERQAHGSQSAGQGCKLHGDSFADRR